MLFVEHDAAGNARTYALPTDAHSRIGIAAAFAVVFFVHQPAMTHNKQSSVLAGTLSVFESLIEPVQAHAGTLFRVRSRGSGSPSALSVRSGIIVRSPQLKRSRYNRQSKNQERCRIRTHR